MDCRASSDATKSMYASISCGGLRAGSYFDAFHVVDEHGSVPREALQILKDQQVNAAFSHVRSLLCLIVSLCSLRCVETDASILFETLM